MAKSKKGKNGMKSKSKVNFNPVLLEEARQKVDKGEILSDVEKTRLSEYVILCQEKINKLSSKKITTDVEKLIIETLKNEIDKYGNEESLPI